MSVRGRVFMREAVAGEPTHIVWTLPPEAALKIVVAEYHVHQPVQKHIALWLSEAVDGFRL
jgi:hypothetical protein